MGTRQVFEDSVVSADLRYWGYYKGRQFAADGSAPKNTVAKILHEGGGGSAGIPGHRVLVVDMTERAWRINALVMRQPHDYIEALVGRYCLPVDPSTGRPYTASEIAFVLQISTKRYWSRLTAARREYRAMLFGETGQGIAYPSKLT